METFMMPIGGKSIRRSTGEEVEIIDAEVKERGARSDEDWVTYIDAEHKEHIKEHLNVQLDFKPVANDVFNKILDSTKPCFPTTRNNRIFDVAKELVLKFQCDSEEAVRKSTELVDAVGIELEGIELEKY
jgi:hypothetical protein